jgi:hypothetical protein
MKQLLTLLFIGIASLYAQTVPSYIPTNGLVGWWPFNGNGNDLFGLNTLTPNGPSGSIDRFGQSNGCLEFEGTNLAAEYLQTINVNPFLSNSYTYSIWFNTDTIRPYTGGLTWSYQSIFCVGVPNYSSGNSIHLNVRTTNLGVGHWTPSTSWVGQNSSPTQVSKNQWYHAVVTYDNGISKLYLNNQLLGQVSIPLVYTQAVKFIVGGDSETPDGSIRGGFDGKLDDFGFWNRALTTSEIQAVFQACSDTILSQPQNFTAYSSTGWANFKCKSTDTSSTYQWQQNIGGGWANLSNFGSYSGSTSDSLVITGVTPAMNNYGYRCIVTGCTTDTSDVAVLTVVNGIGLGESTLQKLTISPNPTAGIVSLNTAVVGNYELLTLDGRVLESGTAKKDYDLTTYPKGVYHLRLSTDEGTRVLKIVKN